MLLCLNSRASLIAQLVKNPRAMQETPIWFLCWEDPLEQGKATHSSILGLPCGSAGKESACIAGDLGSIPGLGRCPGEGKGYPLQYSGLDNSMDCIVHGVAKSRTWLSDPHFHFTLLGAKRKQKRLHRKMSWVLKEVKDHDRQGWGERPFQEVE